MLNNVKVSLRKYPTESDWLTCKECALVTVGLKPINPPNREWKEEILNARHSPIRTLMFLIKIENVPYYISTHLARHIHAQPFIKTSRNDRQKNFDRCSAPQDNPVDMLWWMSAEELMIIANKRLCNMSELDTRRVVDMICTAVIDKCPEFEKFLVPMCEYQGGVCHEMNGGCGLCDSAIVE